mgnify:CR=1 FL=1
MKNIAIDIGVPVSLPNQVCNDQHCPFHGFTKVRGRIFTGTVVREVLHKTATIEFPRQNYLPKYERFERRRTRLKAHIPPCLDIKRGDKIKIMETRPISKTKNFVAIEIIKK